MPRIIVEALTEGALMPSTLRASVNKNRRIWAFKATTSRQKCTRQSTHNQIADLIEKSQSTVSTTIKNMVHTRMRREHGKV